MFFFIEVGHRVALGRLAHPSGCTRAEQKRFCQRRLAGAPMADEHDVAYVLGRIALHGGDLLDNSRVVEGAIVDDDKRTAAAEKYDSGSWVRRRGLRTLLPAGRCRGVDFARGGLPRSC